MVKSRERESSRDQGMIRYECPPSKRDKSEVTRVYFLDSCKTCVNSVIPGFVLAARFKAKPFSCYTLAV